jgi:GNAT superfamily N-acetyltransferase
MSRTTCSARGASQLGGCAASCPGQASPCTVPKVAAHDRFFVRHADQADLDVVGRLLHEFNLEFGEPAPEPEVLAARLGRLLDHGDTAVLVGGDGPDGLALLRFRPALWSSGLESYLAELYVVPARRGHGLGRALMEAALREAKRRGSDTMDIAVDEPDVAARRLYESLGFTNRAGSEDGPLMYVYERDL